MQQDELFGPIVLRPIATEARVMSNPRELAAYFEALLFIAERPLAPSELADTWPRCRARGQAYRASWGSRDG